MGNTPPLRRRSTAVVAMTLLAVAFVGCSDSTEPLPAEGTFTGRWSGEPWVGEAYAVLVDGGDSGDTLYLGGSRPVNAGSMPLESIRIRVLFRGMGTYQLGSSGTNTARFDELTGGDVVHATYSATGLNPGALVITSYDGPGGQIEGRVNFVSVSASPYRSYGAISSFEDGRFRATVNTYP